MATPRKRLTLEELGAMEAAVTKAAFDYSVASMKRSSALRRLGELRRTPLDDRTIEEHQEITATKRSIVEYERAMSEAERVAQDMEAAAVMDQEQARTRKGDAA